MTGRTVEGKTPFKSLNGTNLLVVQVFMLRLTLSRGLLANKSNNLLSGNYECNERHSTKE